jgi:hypothetical protein
MWIGLLGSFGSVLGMWLYRRFLLDASWHGLFTSVTLFACSVSALQLLLFFRSDDDGSPLCERLHMPDIAFALGDDVIVATANQLLAMPILILMARLCPIGAEGTTYALATSLQMSGGTIGGILSQISTRAFGVTNTNFSRLWQLTILTSTAKLSTLLFLPLVPRSASSVRADGVEKRSALAGLVILGLFAGGLVWAIVQIVIAMI